MAFGFGATAVLDQERLGKKAIVSPSIQEISDQFFAHFRDLVDPRMVRNSQNSHSPPAADAPNIEKKKKKSQREKSEEGNQATPVIVVPCMQWKSVIA